MQRKKNLRLLATLIFLIVLTIIVFLTDRNGDRGGVEQELFAVQDTSAITRVDMTGDAFSNSLERTNGEWMINNTYTLDEGLRQVLLSVLKNIQVRRPVSMAEKAEIMNFLKEEGVKVEIYEGQEVLQSFWSGGSQQNNQTYFMHADEEQPYVVHLPGYQSYVAGLFEIGENDWRNRIVLSSNWQGIQELELRYPGGRKNGFRMVAGDRLFNISGIDNPDTTKMMDYLEEVEYILANQYLEQGENPQYDSLAHTIPYATLSIREIGDEQPQAIDFFPRLPDDRFILGRTGGDQLALFEYDRISGLFMSLNDFRREE